jgi:hypothetical protein
MIQGVVGKTTTYHLNPRHIQWIRGVDGQPVVHVKIVDGIELKFPFGSFKERDNWLREAVFQVDVSNESGDGVG